MAAPPAAVAQGPSAQNAVAPAAGVMPAIGFGSPVANGGYLADGNRLLVFNGYYGFGGIYDIATNNTQLFTGQFDLIIYDLVDYNFTVRISLIENGQQFNQTITAVAYQTTNPIVSLVPRVQWTNVELVVGGTAQVYQVAVPVSLLPSAFTNIGGTDLLVLGVVSECLIGLAIAIAMAFWCMRRALWAPKFSLLIWGHVLLIGFASFVLVDYQFVDQTFAGWSPLVYAFVIVPIFWAFSLSYFNRTETAELLRANAPLAGRLSFTRWTLRVGRDPRGRLVIIDPRWRGFWARIFGHHVVLVPEEAEVSMPEPFSAQLVNKRVVSREQILHRVAKPSPAKNLPTDDFELIPASVDGRTSRRDIYPTKLYWTPIGQPVDVTWPRLAIHKTEPVEEVRDPETNVVIVPAHDERHLTWPHYEEGEAHIVLHSLHFRSAMSVLAQWRSVDDLARVLNDMGVDLEALKGSFETRVTAAVRERLLAREALIGRGVADLDESEAAYEAERERKDMPGLDAIFGNRLTPAQLGIPPARETRKREGRRGK
jgi:hypothetical protein